MTVLIIGVVTMTALVWILGVSPANESDAERRQAVRESHNADEDERRAVHGESRRAA